MNPRKLDDLLRKAPLAPLVSRNADFSSGVMQSILSGSDPGRVELMRHARICCPAAAAVSMLTAGLLVTLLPHGPHKPASENKQYSSSSASLEQKKRSESKAGPMTAKAVFLQEETPL